MRQSFRTLGSLSLCTVALLLAPGYMVSAAGKAKGGGDWPEVAAEERALTRIEKDPEADVVILNNERNGKILKRSADWVNVLEYHWRAKVLTAAGKERDEISSVTIPGGKHSRVSNIRARTVSPDGTVHAVADDQIFQRTATYGGVKASEWVFKFPAVEVGSILEYRYDRHDDNLLYVRPFYFDGGGFTLRGRMTQAMPEETGYQFICSRCPPGVKPLIKRWVDGPNKGRIYELELRDLPGYEAEMLMPPRGEVSARIEMVLHSWNGFYSEALGREKDFFVDWPSAARYASYNYKNAGKAGVSELRQEVNAWTEGLVEPDKKARSILRHVQQDFRYIRWDDVWGQSRSVADLLKDRSADNEEKAVLLHEALAMAGIPSKIALVAGKQLGGFNPGFFGLSQFTHAVVVVAGPDGTSGWLDPTVSYAAYGFMPWHDSGASALLLSDLSGEIVAVPVKNEAGRTRYESTIRWKEGQAAELIVTGEFTGEDAIEMREALGPASVQGRQEWLEEWVQGRIAGATLRSHGFENLEDPNESLKLKLEVVAPGVVTSADEAHLVRVSLMTGLASDPIRSPVRSHDLCIDRGWNIQEEVVIETPEGLEPAPLAAAIKTDAGIGRISFQCVTTLEGNVRCSRQFAASRKRWPATQMVNFRKLIDRLVEADRTNVVFRPRNAGGS